MSAEALSDGDLARQIGAERADARAEAELCRRFAHRIRLYGRRHLRDESLADDLVQQVLVLVIQSLREGRVREPDRLASFVLGSCRLLARDMRRGEARRQRLLAQYGVADEATCDETPPLDLERLRGCLEKLTGRERAIVVLTFYGERGGEDIAAELAMTPGNVRVVRHRAIGRLQQCMSDGDGTAS
jgi:RNA polymerase sigma-70 factor (ECF subfamily)